MRHLVWVLVVATVLVIVVSLVVAVDLSIQSDSLPGPKLQTRDHANIIFGQPSRGYSGNYRNWYNFTIESVLGNYTWVGARATITPGTLPGTDNNTTLEVLNATGSLVAPFTELGSNWTCESDAPVEVGQIIALGVDGPSMSRGQFGMAWPGPPLSSWGLGPLPI